jgi:hypothetical protein
MLKFFSILIRNKIIFDKANFVLSSFVVVVGSGIQDEKNIWIRDKHLGFATLFMITV